MLGRLKFTTSAQMQHSSRSERGLAMPQLIFAATGAMLLVVVLGATGYVFRDKFFNSYDPNKAVTLKYWGLWEPTEVMQPLIKSYEQLHPNVTINYEQRPVDNHYETVKSRLLQSGSDVPDIVRIHSSWVGTLRNELAPLPSVVMTNQTYESTFYPVTKQSLYYDNSYYALPLEVDGLSLLVNQSLMTKAGITSTPTTWDEVRQAAAKITEKDKDGHITTGGIAMGTAGNVDHFTDIIGLLMAQNGVAFTDAKGNVTLNQSLSPDGRNLGAEALAFYRLFATTEKYWDDGMENSTVAFSKGKVGMILVPSWSILSIVSQNPQLSFKVAPAPQLTTDRATGYASYWVESVAKSSRNQRQAWEFVKYLTDSEQQVALSREEQKVHSIAEPYSRKDLASALSTDPVLGPYVSQAPTYQTSFLTNDARAAGLNDAIRDQMAIAVNATNGGSDSSSASTALDAFALAATKILTSQR